MPKVEVINCAPHPHVGETLTTNYLRHHLPSGSVLVNYYLPNPPGTLEIDLVVVNSNGVYILEVKHWAGRIEADQVHWLHSSGDQRDSPITIIEHKARKMQGFLKNKGWGHASVVGLVVLSKGTGAFHSTDPNDHKVFGLHKTLIDALTGPKYIHPNKYPLAGEDAVSRLRRVILNNRVADAERRVAGYRVLSERERGHYVELEAEDPEFPGRHKVRIKQYDVPVVGSQEEINKAVARFKRDMSALVRAGPHPNLLMPYKFHRDESSDERYYLILEWSGEQTLAERINAGPVGLKEQIHILKSTVAALAHCHGREVIHRNLSAASIYLYPDRHVKVGNFDFARVPAVTRTLAQTGILTLVGRHISPEQQFQARDVDARADIYSLGAVWYDMLFRPDPDAVLDQAKIDDAPLTNDGKEILHMMVAEHRSGRPRSMEEVQEWLALLG